MTTKQFVDIAIPDVGDGGNGMDASVTGTKPAKNALTELRDAGAALDVSANALVYGDGSDGDLVLDGTTTVLGMVPSGLTYTATRDLFPDNLTLESGVTLFMNGFRLFVATKCILDETSVIHNNGKNASANTAGAATNTSAPTAVGTAGGNGRSGSSGVGLAGTNTAIGFPGISGGGGAGGGDGTNAGGAGGANTALAAVKGGARQLFSLLMGVCFGTQASGTALLASSFGGGCGGGGGATDNADGTAGGGGGGGGVLIAAIRNLENNGTISANGGVGADGLSAANNAGGGGGGQGGVVILITRASTGEGDVTASGGAGGAKAGSSGVAGAAGSAGVVIQAVA